MPSIVKALRLLADETRLRLLLLLQKEELSVVELHMQAEEAFGVEIPDEAIGDARTVADVARLIRNAHRPARPQPGA